MQPVTYRWADRQRSSLRSLRRLNLSIGVLCAAAACLLAAGGALYCAVDELPHTRLRKGVVRAAVLRFATCIL